MVMHGVGNRARSVILPPPRQIVLIVLDDVPRNSLSFYGARHGLTPNMDALSHDSVTFDSAFTTAPLCTPSRFSILTGRHAANASSITTHRPWNVVGFNTFLTGRETTLAHALRNKGYGSCFVGKCMRQTSNRLGPPLRLITCCYN